MRLEISNEQLHKELERVLRKNLSLDRYVEARRVLKLGVKDALRYAALEPGRASISMFEDALDLKLRPSQILGLAETRRSLTYITRLMKHGGATLEEAVEAHHVAVTDMGVFSYTGLRTKGAKHQAIIDAWLTAVNSGLRKDIFMTYFFAVKLGEAEAIEIARTGLDPAVYVAAVEQGFAHEVIVEHWNAWQGEWQFVQQIEKAAEQQGPDAMAQIRRQLYNARC